MYIYVHMYTHTHIYTKLLEGEIIARTTINDDCVALYRSQ